MDLFIRGENKQGEKAIAGDSGRTKNGLPNFAKVFASVFEIYYIYSQ